MLKQIGRYLILLVQNWRPFVLPSSLIIPKQDIIREEGHFHSKSPIVISSDKDIIIKSGPNHRLWLNPRLDSLGFPIEEKHNKVHVAYKDRPSTLFLKHKRNKHACSCCKH